MTVTAARAEFIKVGYRSVESGPDTAVQTKYGDTARKTTEPVETFFEAATDAQAMCDERMDLLSGDRRKFVHDVSGESVGIGLDYSQTAPQATVIDDRRAANHPAICVEIIVDFQKQITSLDTWGGN